MSLFSNTFLKERIISTSVLISHVSENLVQKEVEICLSSFLDSAATVVHPLLPKRVDSPVC